VRKNLTATVVIVDRGASTSDPLVQKWNKMAIHALSLPHSPNAFEPLRHSMAKHLGHRFSSAPIRSRPGKSLGSVPKVVYIDRQDTSRHIVREDHEGLLRVLGKMKGDGEIEFLHGEFGKMKHGEQVGSIMDADVSVAPRDQ
jgi:hypothetical protein